MPPKDPKGIPSKKHAPSKRLREDDDAASDSGSERGPGKGRHEKGPAPMMPFTGAIELVTEGVTSNHSAQLLPCEHQAVFERIVGMNTDAFYNRYFDQEPLFLERNDPEYYSTIKSPLPVLWSTEAMRNAVRTKELYYGTDLNVVRYDRTQKQRVSFKTSGKVTIQDFDKVMKEGWSIRFLRPHEHVEELSRIIYSLEEHCRCSGGLNTYWTPAGSQGFGPHYDDVDVFLLQMEGHKNWRLYPPPDEVDILTRHSSDDYDPNDLPKKPLMSITLKRGDMLYMPRGMVHQGTTDPDEHSLHVTFSVNQMHTYADLLLTLYQRRVETLAANSVEMRRALPRAWLTELGAMAAPELAAELFPGGRPEHALEDEARIAQTEHGAPHTRQILLKRIRDFCEKVNADALTSHAADDAGDMFAIQDISRRQPPPLSAGVRQEVTQQATLDDRIVVISKAAARLELTTEEARVVHCGFNSSICGAVLPGKLRFERDFAPAIVAILSAYPMPFPIAQLPMPAFEEEDAKENRLILANALLESHVFALDPFSRGDEAADGAPAEATVAKGKPKEATVKGAAASVKHKKK